MGRPKSYIMDAHLVRKFLSKNFQKTSMFGQFRPKNCNGGKIIPKEQLRRQSDMSPTFVPPKTRLQDNSLEIFQDLPKFF